ncbi:hypothetical protein GE107_23890 [Cohnella sp. CFH 77786]|uniref:glycoside hydrolase family 88 protein n=1 Tax=Cohnella sp. CFH 77786 TaxID=2662265 RepID=UPI001C60A86A|nr:glycoside hydrolase family 88 protein [Cohnella sp. CFH 77786]MBW5449076.1 hypothetical protein [Cohnella sp. CFH 77786]
MLRADGGQGFGPDSAWSRGQAWALYGMANIYKHTGEVRYLEAAQRSEDLIPYWDFRLPELEGQPRDTSAAAIAASGLLELAESCSAPVGRTFRTAAERILSALTERHSALDRKDLFALLTEGTGHVPENKNIHVSLIYGDYFYLEAVAKLAGWNRRFF